MRSHVKQVIWMKKKGGGGKLIKGICQNGGFPSIEISGILWFMGGIMKIVGKIQQNCGISSMGVWKS